MKRYLDEIREPIKRTKLSKDIINTLIIILSGFVLGIMQKWLDGSAYNELPIIFQKMDIVNYFGRLGIWMLLGTLISVYSRSPLRAGINVFLFLLSMITGYYLYSNYVLGFLPKLYMMIWIGIAFFSFFIAYICWYAKGEGIISILISSVILGVLFSQAVLIFQGIRITHVPELVTWLIGVLILYRKPKELVLELGLSLVVALIYQSFIPYFG